MLGKLLKKAAENNKLQRKYQLLNSAVVAVGVILAFPTWIALAKWSRLALGLPLGAGSLDGLVVPFLVWIILFLLITVFVWFAGIIFVAAVSSFVLMLLGKMQSKEVPRYVLRSEYPRSWYEPEKDKSD